VPADAADDSEDWKGLLNIVREQIAASPGRWTRSVENVVGVSEETTTGVHRL